MLKQDDTYYTSSVIMDLASLYDNETPEKLTSVNYTHGDQAELLR